MDNRKIIVFAILLNLITGPAQANRVLFYEIGSGQYSIEKDYSQFANELRRRGYEVASIEQGGIDKEKLEYYDILIVQNLNRQLTTNEISAIIWFVLQKGRGLFINGGGSGRANQLTVPFGVTIDNGLLIDTSDQITGLKDRHSFIIHNLPDNPDTQLLREGVSRIGFYKDSGLFLSGNAKCIARGDSDTYSNTGSFAAGSFPCVASASLFGGGLVVTMSNPNMLSNKHIGDFNNRNFGMNIMDWLSLSAQNIPDEDNPEALGLRIKEMRLNNIRLEQELNRTISEKNRAQSQVSSLSLELSAAVSRIEEIEDTYVGPFKQSSWAMILLGISVLVAAIIISKKKGGSEAKIKDEDILNELGYELDEPQGGDDELAL